MSITLPNGHFDETRPLSFKGILWLGLVLLAALGAMLFSLILRPFKRVQTAD